MGSEFYFKNILIIILLIGFVLVDLPALINMNISVSTYVVFLNISNKKSYHKGIPESSIIDIRRIHWANHNYNTEHTLYIKDNFTYFYNRYFHQNISNRNRNTIYHLRDCYVSGTGAVLYNNSFIQSKKIPGSIRYLYVPFSGKVKGVRDVVVSTGHKMSGIYGHFIQDGLSPLMEIPQEILQDSTVTICTGGKLVREFFPTLNICKEVIKLGPNDWIYAKELYIHLNPRPHIIHLGPCMRKLTLLVREKFNLTGIVPYRYIISQRKTRFRVIGNFNELFNAVKNAYPEIPWEKDLQTSRPVNETVKIWSNAKMYYAVCGSNFFNAVFFPQSVVAIIVFGNVYDCSALAVMSSNNYRIVLYQEPKMKHFQKMKIDFNLTRALLAFELAFYVEKNNTWPNVSNAELFR